MQALSGNHNATNQLLKSCQPSHQGRDVIVSDGDVVAAVHQEVICQATVIIVVKDSRQVDCKVCQRIHEELCHPSTVQDHVQRLQQHQAGSTQVSRMRCCAVHLCICS